MTISLIQPALEVLEDQRVTVGELNWLIRELLVVVIMTVLVGGFFSMAERSVE